MSVARIARHEIRHATRTHLLALLGTLVALLLVSATTVGRSREAVESAQRERFQTLVQQSWDAQPDRHPHRVSHYGFLVFRPRSPLSLFDTGVETFTGTSIFLEAHRQNSSNFSEASYTDGSQRFGELTMAMVLQLFVPLLIFTMSGIAITRERESATLALLLCQGVPWRSFILGKLAGALVCVAIMVVPSLVLASALLVGPSSGTWAWGPSEIARAALLVAVHVAFLGACTAGAVLASAVHRTSRGALLTLVSVWIALWIVLPRALPGVAASIYPSPHRAEFDARVERQVRTLGDSHNPNDAAFQAIRAGYLAKYNVSRVEDLPINYNGIVMLEGEKLTTRAYRDHLAALLATYRRQTRLVESAGFLSPYVAIRNVSMALSGVDVAHALEFERQAEDYRYTVTQHLNALHIEEVTYARDRYVGAGEGGAPTRERISRRHWAQLPTFTFAEPGVAWSVKRQMTDLVALFFWITILVLGAALVARRTIRP